MCEPFFFIVSFKSLRLGFQCQPYDLDLTGAAILTEGACALMSTMIAGKKNGGT